MPVLQERSDTADSFNSNQQPGLPQREATCGITRMPAAVGAPCVQCPPPPPKSSHARRERRATSDDLVASVGLLAREPSEALALPRCASVSGRLTNSSAFTPQMYTVAYSHQPDQQPRE